MSYLGRVTNKPSDIRVFDVTSSTSATHTLTWTAPNEQSLIVTINGVKQHEDAYSVSGTTLTLTDALVATDKLEVVGINDIGTTITPAEGSVNTSQLANDSVATAKIQDDAVTADKLANSINTEITANTAKVTNATHTGDVTGATALTIANDAVDIAMLSATGTADATTFLRGDNAWVAVAGGLTIADQWRLTTNFTGTVNPISTNLERVDTAQQATLGSAMTESSGVFTFPETGYYLIEANLCGRTASSSAERSHGINIDVTLDDSTYVTVANSSNSGYNSGDSTDYSGDCCAIVDVTDTANVKVKFRVSTVTGSTITRGGTSTNTTTFTFIKLADT
tara:strand:- start:15 stop:1028 length:1014 start_codon:yes stop_codon:yes gene_type:complete